MKKTVLICGLIAGLISFFWYVFSDRFFDSSVSFNTRLFWGYASMVLGFSLIFVGVKSYRDNHNGGVITFGRALKISLLITLVASTVYVAGWMIDYYFFIPDFSGKYMALERAQLVAKGVGAAQIQKQMAEMAKEFELYKNPLFNILMTYAEIAPVGAIVSLVASLILKNNPKPATANAQA